MLRKRITSQIHSNSHTHKQRPLYTISLQHRANEYDMLFSCVGDGVYEVLYCGVVYIKRLAVSFKSFSWKDTVHRIASINSSQFCLETEIRSGTCKILFSDFNEIAKETEKNQWFRSLYLCGFFPDLRFSIEIVEKLRSPLSV